jgi:hypothetical protein
VAAAFVGLHDLQPLLQVAGEAAAGGGVDAARARSPSITKAQQGEPLQPFCGALISTSTPVAHVHPHRAGGDAVEHEQAAHLVHRVGHGRR